jgi:hypothetical protein
MSQGQLGTFPKSTFWAKLALNRSLNNFRGVQNYIFKNYSQMDIEKHKNFVQKIYFFQAPQMDFTFLTICTGLAPC